VQNSNGNYVSASYNSGTGTWTFTDTLNTAALTISGAVNPIFPTDLRFTGWNGGLPGTEMRYSTNHRAAPRIALDREVVLGRNGVGGPAAGRRVHPRDAALRLPAHRHKDAEGILLRLGDTAETHRRRELRLARLRLGPSHAPARQKTQPGTRSS
jgi:hypothetical protein